MMEQKCSLNSINKILMMISLFALPIILIITILYFINVKNNCIKEKFNSGWTEVNKTKFEGGSVNEKDPGVGCTSSSGLYTSTMSLNRPCQVYFTPNTDACDRAKAADKYNTCKYEFDGWKEFSSWSQNGEDNPYVKKIYDGQVVNSAANNYAIISKCFKEIPESGEVPKYEMNINKNDNRDIFRRDCPGANRIIAGDATIVDTNVFNGKKYKSFKFNESTDELEENYSKILDKICSIKYPILTELNGIYLHKINITFDHKIKTDGFVGVNLSQDQTSFVLNKNFLLSSITEKSDYRSEEKGLYYDANKFIKFKTVKLKIIPVVLYSFKYNYLCDNSQIQAYKTYATSIDLNKLFDTTNLNVYKTIDNLTVPEVFKNYMTSFKYDANTPNQKTALLNKINQVITMLSQPIIQHFDNVKSALNNEQKYTTARECLTNKRQGDITTFTFDKVVNQHRKNMKGYIILKRDSNYDLTVKDSLKKVIVYYKGLIVRKFNSYYETHQVAGKPVEQSHLLWVGRGITKIIGDGIFTGTGGLHSANTRHSHWEWESKDRLKGENYTFQWEGYFRAKEGGAYRFRTHSDDASHVYLTDDSGVEQLVVDNRNLHGWQHAQGNIIQLQKGNYYPIRILMGEWSGGDNINFEWQENNGDWLNDGSEYFFCNEEQYNLITTNYTQDWAANNPWKWCGVENDVCKPYPEDPNKTYDIRYGKSGTWVQKNNLKGSTTCSYKLFGDPMYGVYKECQWKPSDASRPEQRITKKNYTDVAQTVYNNYYYYIVDDVHSEYIFEIPPGDKVGYDVLLVGGGGGGGYDGAGGGGGGQVQYYTMNSNAVGRTHNQLELSPGKYKLVIGKGGKGGGAALGVVQPEAGGVTKIVRLKEDGSEDVVIAQAGGGAAGGNRNLAGSGGTTGGGGGSAMPCPNESGSGCSGGIPQPENIQNSDGTQISVTRGKGGRNAGNTGGGGGSGVYYGNDSEANGINAVQNQAGSGGKGALIDILNGYTGRTFNVGGGGGGGSWNAQGGVGGSGGGGRGGSGNSIRGESGIDGTGGGGGASGYAGTNVGGGGSGIIVIKLPNAMPDQKTPSSTVFTTLFNENTKFINHNKTWGNDDLNIYREGLDKLKLHYNVVSNDGTTVIRNNLPNMKPTTTDSNDIFTYNIYAYMYLQKGYYKFKTFLQVEPFIPYMCEFYFVEYNQSDTSYNRYILSGMYIKYVQGMESKFETKFYTTKNFLKVEQSGFYKIYIKAFGYNYFQNTQVKNIKPIINFEYFNLDKTNINVIDKKNIRFEGADRSMEGVSNHFDNFSIPNVALNSTSSFNTNLDVLKTKINGSVSNVNLVNYLYYELDLDNKFLDIYRDINSFGTNTTDNFKKYIEVLDSADIDQWKINTFDNNKSAKSGSSNKFETYKKVILSISTTQSTEGDSSAGTIKNQQNSNFELTDNEITEYNKIYAEGSRFNGITSFNGNALPKKPPVNQDILALKNFYTQVEQISLIDLDSTNGTATLNTNINVWSCFVSSYNENDKNNIITIEKYSRGILQNAQRNTTILGGVPDSTEIKRSIYISGL
jgi:hypothetical protein